MTQDELKKAIAETLHRNLGIAIDDMQNEAGKDSPPRYIRVDVVENVMDSCAANLAQAIPEMFATVVLNETVAAAVRRVREQEREACAAKLDAMADEISEDSASRAQQLRAAAEAVRKQGA